MRRRRRHRRSGRGRAANPRAPDFFYMPHICLTGLPLGIERVELEVEVMLPARRAAWPGIFDAGFRLRMIFADSAFSGGTEAENRGPFHLVPVISWAMVERLP